MSSKMPIVLFVVVLAALIGGIFFYSHKRIAPTANTATQTTQSITPVPTSALPAGNSDTQLNKDTTQIDSSMNSFTNDTTTVDQGLNDQPGNLQ